MRVYELRKVKKQENNWRSFARTNFKKIRMKDEV